MIRLVYSSKFWALLIGGVVLGISAALGWNDAQAEETIKQVLAVYAAVAPVIYAIMTGLEDALSDGSIDLEELAQILKDLLSEE